MKTNIIRYGCWALLAFVTAGCNDFLNVEQKGRTTIPAFLSTPQGLKAGLAGTYNTLYAYYDNEFLKYPEVTGNMSSMNLSSGSSMLEQYNFTPNPGDGTTSYYIWKRMAEAMTNANNIIQYEPAVESAYPTQAAECKQILGQALLIRAMVHFDMVRVYAQPYNYTADASHIGIPVQIKSPGPDDNLARNTVKEVYDQILSDLNQAAQILTDEAATDVHYGSLQAVNAQLSRVYLYMENWQQALTYAQRAIGTQTLAQADDYINMFMNLNTRGETILRLSGKDINGKLKGFYESECLPADTLLTLFDTDDIRLRLLRFGGEKKCMKYTATTIPDNQDKREDPILFRLSEMYLTAAEAAWHLNNYTEARSHIKAVMERAVGTVKADAALTACTDAELLELILKERVKELCFEGHNFFDLTRRKQSIVREAATNATVKRINYPSKYFVLPIPRYELNANGRMQPNENND